MGDTSIEWTDKTWNPIRGCSRVSAGCEHCYAETMAGRFSGPGQAFEGLTRKTPTGARWTGKVRLVPEHLADPLRWKKPRRVFVNSMSDLFHEGLSLDAIDQVFAVMLLSPRHTFQVLTKRPTRMRNYLSDPNLYDRVLERANQVRDQRPGLMGVGIANPRTFPAKWIWLGVSVEDQATADERIPLLLETPAAVRFVSYEPALGPVRFGSFLALGGLDWIIGGSESGPGHRLAEMDWFRSVRDECDRAAVAFFFKQFVARTFGKVSLPVLDGRQHAEFPR